MVLSTDGAAIFVTILHNYNTIRSRVAVTFITGDRKRLLRIPRNALEEINLFRIDGMLM